MDTSKAYDAALKYIIRFEDDTGPGAPYTPDNCVRDIVDALGPDYTADDIPPDVRAAAADLELYLRRKHALDAEYLERLECLRGEAARRWQPLELVLEITE